MPSCGPAARRSVRHLQQAVRGGQDLLTNGAFPGRAAHQDRPRSGHSDLVEIPAVKELVVQNGRVNGVSAVRDGVPVLIQGQRQASLLSAGGFDHNQRVAEEVLLPRLSRTTARGASATPGNTGEVLDAAIGLGAEFDYMDEAIWYLSPRGEMAGSTLVPRAPVPQERSSSTSTAGAS